MKKTGKKIAILAAVAAASFGLAALTSCGGKGKFSYELNEDGASYTLVEYSKKAYKTYALSVPEKYKGLPVSGIGGNAFADEDYISSVSIPSSVKEIGNYAFRACSSLKTVEIAEGTTDIGAGVFAECRYLTAISVPSTLERIGSCVYDSDNVVYNEKDGVRYLGNAENPYVAAMKYVGTNKEVVLDEGCRAVANYFTSSDVENIELNEGLISVGAAAFNGKSEKIMTVDLPESLKYVGGGAFGGLTSLTAVELPASVESIGTKAFGDSPLMAVSYGGTLKSWCEDVTRGSALGGMLMIADGLSDTGALTIPEGVKTIGDYAFTYCSNVVSVDIPESVETIGVSAFQGSNLVAVAGMEGVKTVEERAFRECKNLLAISFGDALERLKTQAFVACSKLTMIGLPEKPLELGSSLFDYAAVSNINPYVEDILWIGKHVLDVRSASGAFTLPDDTLSIAGGAFYNTDITSFVFPKNITYVSKGLFEDCEQLESVTLPEGMTVLEERTFYCCSSLKELALPSTVVEIAEDAIVECENLKKLTLPKGIIRIGNNEGIYADTKPTDIYYAGSKKEWGKIAIDWELLNTWIDRKEVTVHYGS